MNKVRIGIIGFGNMGTGHVANLTKGKIPNMELAAACDTEEARRQAFKNAYPQVPVFKDAESMYQSGLCDAVLIAVPHYEHPSLAIKARYLSISFFAR